MKSTTIPVKEDLKWRLNQLKYAWGYKTLDHVIRRLIELKTPPITTAKSHQNSSTTTLFTNSYNNSSGGADNNHRDAEVEDKGTRCKESIPVNDKEKENEKEN